MDPDGSMLLTAAADSEILSADPAGKIVFQLLLLAVLICANAFFAASELAIISLNDNKLRRDAESGRKNARRLLRLTSNASRFLATIQVGVTLSGFLASAVAATGFAGMIASSLAGVLPVSEDVVAAVATIVITLLLSFLTLVFGELVPKRIAMHRPERIAYGSAKALSLLSVLARPFIWLLTKTTNGVLRLFRIDPNQQEETVTEEEIRMMVDEGEEKGVIEESTSEMISNVFEFDDITVGEIMTHRTEISAVEEESGIDEVLQIAIREGYSRIPVYHGRLDNITGVCYVKDLLPYVGRELPQRLLVRSLMRETTYIPEAKKCGELLEELQRSKMQMAVVVDEYGGTAGIVTMEDLLESIVGNIQDEYDNEEEEIVQISESEFTVDGTINIDEISDLLEVSLPEGDYDTLGGMILERLGRIPQPLEHPQVEAGGCRFTVETLEDRRIGRVRVEKLRKDIPQGK